MRYGHLFMPVAVGLTVGAAILSLKQLNPGKDPARVSAEAHRIETIYVSVLPPGYVGSGCTMGTMTTDSSGRPITVMVSYACSVATAAPSTNCPAGTVEKRFGSSVPVCASTSPVLTCSPEGKPCGVLEYTLPQK